MQRSINLSMALHNHPCQAHRHLFPHLLPPSSILGPKAYTTTSLRLTRPPRGGRKAELFRIIWRSDIREGTNLMEVISSMRRPFKDFIASITAMDDSQLAFAILIALPDSFSTLDRTFI